jgi:cell cycle checkpoint protein
MGIQIIEWKNGLDDWRIGDINDITDGRCCSTLLQWRILFNIHRSSISLSEIRSLPDKGQRIPDPAISETLLGSRRRLLLVDDLPNIQNHAIKEAFHAALEAFVESSGSSTCPLVVIISDAGVRAEMSQSDGNSWRSKQQDTIDFRSVFPKSLQTSPLVEQVMLVV